MTLWPSTWRTGLPGYGFLGGLSGSTLLDGLVSWWPLDEESGTRVDVVGGYNLTDVNTVTYDTGKIGNAAFAHKDRSERLTHANYPFPTGDFTISYWVYGNYGWPTDDEGVSNNGTHMFIGDNYPNNCIRTYNGGYLGSLMHGKTDGYFQANGLYGNWIPYNDAWKWTHFIGTCDKDGGANGTGTVTYVLRSEDYSSPRTQTTDNGVGDSIWVPSGDETLYLFSDHNVNFSKIRLDCFGIYNRILSTDEQVEMYNLGSGISHPF